MSTARTAERQERLVERLAYATARRCWKPNHRRGLWEFEEAVSVAMLAGCEAVRSYDGVSSELRSWIISKMWHALSDAVRSPKHGSKRTRYGIPVPVVVSLDQPIPGTGTLVEDLVGVDDQEYARTEAAVLCEALERQMEPKDWSVLRERFAKGRTLREIAEERGCSDSLVYVDSKKALARARLAGGVQ